MRSITFMSCIIVLLAVQPVAAQIDPDPDGIGIYFDEAATQVATEAPISELVEAYLIATRSSQSGGSVADPSSKPIRRGRFKRPRLILFDYRSVVISLGGMATLAWP